MMQQCHDSVCAPQLQCRLSARLCRLSARLGPAPPQLCVTCLTREIHGLERIVRVVRKVSDAPAHRGAVSTRIARLAKEVKSVGQQSQQVTLRVRGLIQRYNQNHAKTREDEIQFKSSANSMAEFAPGPRKKGSGSGSWKQWLPASLLRACWGKRLQRRVAAKVTKRHRLLRKTKTPKSRVCSSDSFFDSFMGSRTECQHHPHCSRAVCYVRAVSASSRARAVDSAPRARAVD